MEIRPAVAEDLPALVAIYNQAIEAGRCTGDLVPFSVESRRGWWESRDLERFPILVAVLDDQVVGYASLSPYRPGRGALRHTAEVSHYVDFRHHRKGVGMGLVEAAIRTAGESGYRTLLAIVVDGNESSLGLLRRCGFERWGFLPGVLDFDGTELGHVYLGRRIARTG